MNKSYPEYLSNAGLPPHALPQVVSALDQIRGIPSLEVKNIHLLSHVERSFSWVLKVRLDTLTWSGNCYLKIAKPDQASFGVEGCAVDRLSKEVKVLQRLEEGFRDFEGLSSLKLIAFIESSPCILTEEVKGRTISKLVSQGARFPGNGISISKLEETVSFCAKWLLAFQSIMAEGEPKLIDIDDMRTYISIRAAKLLELGGIDKFLYGCIENKVDELALEVEREDCMEVPVHGDFSPSNIIIGDIGVTGMDLDMVGTGGKYHDAARFCHQMDLIGYKPGRSSAAIMRVKNAFLSSYGHGVNETSPLYMLSTISHVLCHMVGVEIGMSASLKGRIYDRYIAIRNKERLKRLCCMFR